MQCFALLAAHLYVLLAVYIMILFTVQRCGLKIACG